MKTVHVTVALTHSYKVGFIFEWLDLEELVEESCIFLQGTKYWVAGYFVYSCLSSCNRSWDSFRYSHFSISFVFESKTNFYWSTFFSQLILLNSFSKYFFFIYYFCWIHHNSKLLWINYTTSTSEKLGVFQWLSFPLSRIFVSFHFLSLWRYKML